MTGAVNRDFWTRGSFADFVACTVLGEPRRADFDFVNLHVQNSWQAQHFVNLHAPLEALAVALSGVVCGCLRLSPVVAGPSLHCD